PATAPAARRGGCASFALSLLVTGVAALYAVAVRTLYEFLKMNGPTLHGYALRGEGVLLVPAILLPVGLIVGLAVTIRNRLWLGLVLLPMALALGVTIYVAAAW